MGCINSKKDLSDINPNIYRVVNVDADGIALWNGNLEITPKELILYRKSKEPTCWPLQHLRRYGFDSDVFTFEAGRRCTTGEGIYAFRCRGAENLFRTLQTYIQGIALNDDGTQQIGDMGVTATGLNGGVLGLSRSSRQGQTNSRPNSLTQNQNTSTNYVIPNSRTQSLSPNGTIHSSNPSRSTDTLTAEGNYLEPTPLRSNLGTRYSSGMRLGSVSSGPLSPEPNSPGSPNSFTNILEVTQLNNQPHHQQYQNSNLYLEFPFRSGENNNNLLNKKLSLDIPPQEPAPPLTTGQQASVVTTYQTSNQSNETHNISSPQHHQNVIHSPNEEDTSHMYVNVTPGELDGIVGGGSSGTPTAVTTTQINFGFARVSSAYSIDPATRCYENLEPGEFRPNLLRNRYSKPDIFAKVDLPPLTPAPTNQIIKLNDKSEPSTPTIKQNRKVNYIVLDLDQSPSSSSLAAAAALAATSTGGGGCNNSSLSFIPSGNSNNLTATTTTTTTSAATTTTSSINNAAAMPANNAQTIPLTKSCSAGSGLIQNQHHQIATNATIGNVSMQQQQNTFYNNNINNNNINNNIKVTTPTIPSGTSLLLPPESPKKASLGYATIDFNKTAALSNSTVPSSELDGEGSRKTRHSSTAARHSNSISD